MYDAKYDTKKGGAQCPAILISATSSTSYAIATMQKQAGMTNINFGTVAAKTWDLLLK